MLTSLSFPPMNAVNHSRSYLAIPRPRDRINYEKDLTTYRIRRGHQLSNHWQEIVSIRRLMQNAPGLANIEADRSAAQRLGLEDGVPDLVPR